MGSTAYRMSAAEYLAIVSKKSAALPGKRMSKFGNRKSITESGEKYDSTKEYRHHQILIMAKNAADPAHRVVDIRRQVPYELVPKQEGERAVKYIADFVVEYASGVVEVQDTKSPPTRADKTYVIKRKLMLSVWGIRIQEF